MSQERYCWNCYQRRNYFKKLYFFIPGKVGHTLIFHMTFFFVSDQYFAALVNIVWFAVTCAIIIAAYISNSQKHRLANEKGMVNVTQWGRIGLCC